SFAVSQLIENVLRQAISPRPKGVPVPDLFDNAIRLGPITIGLLPLITAGVGVVSLYGLTLFLRRSRAGLSMRAASQDFTTARLVGVRANGVLAGIAGVLWISRTTAVAPTTGFTPILEAFIASVIGGLGNLTGAVIGGF